MYRSSKSTIHYFRKTDIFEIIIHNNRKCLKIRIEMIDVDLPSLQSIQLGEESLAGRYNDASCSLKMKSMDYDRCDD